MKDILNLEQKAEMRVAIEEIWSFFPPYGVWQRFIPYLTPNIKKLYEVYWQGIISTLYAFTLNHPQPNFLYLNAPIKELISVDSHYYKLTFLMICQSEQKFLRPEIETWGIEYIFSKKFFLLKLMTEDYLQFLEVLQHTIVYGKYEFPSGQEWLDSFCCGVKFLRGDINKNIFDKNGQRFLNKEKKLNNSLNFNTRNPNYGKCNSMCLRTWYQNQTQIPAYDSWVEALDGCRTMFAKKESPAFGMLKKTLFNYNLSNMVETLSYPGRGKKKDFS